MCPTAISPPGKPENRDLYCWLLVEIEGKKSAGALVMTGFYMSLSDDRGIFHEEAVNKILKDFVEKIHPKRVEVVGNFNVRGGIHTTVRARYPDSPRE